MAGEVAKMFDSDTRVRNLEIPADESQLSRVRDFVSEVCSEANFTARETNNTKLAVDEACTNIIKHAYAFGEGNIRIKAIIKAGWVDISLLDTGRKFDFASVKDPDLNQYVESGKKGGLGVFLINRLMDGVDYKSTAVGNELTLTKRSHTAISRAFPGHLAWRDSLKFKFTLRASIGLLLLISLIGTFTLTHQTRAIREQKTTQWLERRRLAANLASKSKDLLLKPETYSIEQTNLSAYLSKLLDVSDDLAYARVVDTGGRILSSSHINEIFSQFSEPEGELLLAENSRVIWKRVSVGERFVRDIAFPVGIRDSESNRLITLGKIHLGIYEDIVEADVKDPRMMTVMLLCGIFLLGVLLIMLLVSLFVKPIQVLTDGVRAIGEGTLDGKISVDGPAEIGAIAAVFNEITQKFKNAQDSILEQEKMQKEIEVAKEIQQSLLPRKMPDVSGYDIATLYQAAAEVGGDYFDFVQVDEDTIGVVVADVSGKGVPGSLVMTMIRTALRMEARENKNASDVMSRMNEFVTDDMKKGMFVTMFYVILDSKNRIISYASAGHNPMILYRYETNETYFLNPKGFPVGINLPDETLFRDSINVEKIKLKKDDMLVIYTDGVTEAMNEKREQYGEERLINLIKNYGQMHPQEFMAQLDKDIKKFTGGNPQNDDITIVAIKEKLTADDVLYGIRKRLIDMVEVEGISVRDACEKMKVSPATYYRYKKRLELLGDRGLRNKILRQDLELKRVSLEDRKTMLEVIRQHPEFGAKRIAIELNKGRTAFRQVKEKIIYDELKRLNLNTKELRLEYLKRYHLVAQQKDLKPEAAVVRKKIVEEFLEEVAKGELPDVEEKEKVILPGEPSGAAGLAGDDLDLELKGLEAIEEAGVEAEKVGGDVMVLHIKGHMDSVSTSSFEKNLTAVIQAGEYKIVVDLTDVSYISSGGWGIFTGEVRKLREKGGDVVLVGMAPEVYDVFELLGFGEILAAFQTIEEAVEYFKKTPEERLIVKESKAADLAGISLAAPEGESGEFDGEEAIPGESYVPEWESLKIEAATVGSDGDIAVLSLGGIIDTVSAEHLRKAFDRIVSGGICKIVVDMSQVEYVSSGGWGTFTERLREVRRSGGDIKLFGMDPDVYYVFTMLGFNIVLSSFDILSDAIEDFVRGTKMEPAIPAAGPGDKEVLQPEPMVNEPEEDEENGIEEVINSSILYKVSGRESLIKWGEPGKGKLIARLEGAIETSVIEQLDLEIQSRITGRPKFLLFNLAGVSYISSAGWGIFVKFHEKCQEWNGRVALSNMSTSLHEIYSCLEFHSFLKAYASEHDAMAAFSGSGKRSVLGRAGDISLKAKSPAPEAEASKKVPDESLSPDGKSEVIEEGIRSIDEILEDGSARPASKDEMAGLAGAEDGSSGEKVIPDLEASNITSVEGGDRAGKDERLRSIEIPKSKPDDLSDETREMHGNIQGAEFPLVEGQDVDVDKAVANEKINEDGKLRKLGWDYYGDKLRKKVEEGKRSKRSKDKE